MAPSTLTTSASSTAISSGDEASKYRIKNTSSAPALVLILLMLAVYIIAAFGANQ